MTTQRLQLTYTALMVLFVALFALPLSTQARAREASVGRSADDAVVCGERKVDAAMAKSATGYITQEETPAEKYCTITIESEHGRVVLRDGSTVLTTEDLKKVKKGTHLSIEAIPDAGYLLDKITANGKDITGAKSIEINEDTTITATFTATSAITFVVTVTESRHGRVVLRDGSTVLTTEDLKKVKKGTHLSIEAIPDAGYLLDKVTANGKDVTGAKSIEINEDTTITATFKKESSIGEVTTDAARIKAIYTIDGRQILTLQKGVNIVVYTTGSVDKVFIE